MIATVEPSKLLSTFNNKKQNPQNNYKDNSKEIVCQDGLYVLNHLSVGTETTTKTKQILIKMNIKAVIYMSSP